MASVRFALILGLFSWFGRCPAAQAESSVAIAYKQPNPSLCDVVSRFGNGFLCAIRPSRLDSNARDSYYGPGHRSPEDRYYGFGYHVVVFPAPGTLVKGVYVHFKGSYGRPFSQDTGKFPDKGFLEESAQAGYLTIQLAYSNRYAINNEECASNRNLDNCAGRLREDKLTGVALSPADLAGTTIEDTPVADSIEHRLKVLTRYLKDQGFQFPRPFLQGEKILWNQLRVGGHSQGSGIAAYLAKNVGVEHACYLAGIHDTNDYVDNPPRNATADWLLKPGTQTPVQKQKAVLCQDDPSVEGFRFGLSLLGLQEGTSFSASAFSNGYFDQDGNSTDAHSAAVLDPRFKEVRDSACFGSPSVAPYSYSFRWEGQNALTRCASVRMPAGAWPQPDKAGCYTTYLSPVAGFPRCQVGSFRWTDGGIYEERSGCGIPTEEGFYVNGNRNGSPLYHKKIWPVE